MDTITSKDGTPIAYRRSGKGPALVLVHGTAADHGRWRPVLPALEERFTVYAVDRRGRGGSGDAEGYAIEREFEDVAAVVDSIGKPANLLGHSYGALCALEAALHTRSVRKLVLYDPEIEVAGQEIYPHEVIERLEALLGAGETGTGWWRPRCARSPGCRPKRWSTCSRCPRGKRGWTRRTRSRGNCGRSRPMGSIRSGSGTSRCRRCC